MVFEGESLTYAALNARANRVAHVLRDMGVGPGTLVALCTRRSLDLLVGRAGIQKAGGAYVPMDPAYPADRLALYVEDSAAPVIVTQSDAVRRPARRMPPRCWSSTPTRGSTQRPTPTPTAASARPTSPT